MRLTKLEIKGFKSFGDPVSITFGEGVTGIVGPNGCGKSNVVDAIRWVLGEQRSKSLRSDKMENIIFNGTKARKPAPTAQVSLTFVNDRQLLAPEYTYVTITRRYHRSGDSEYLINDVRCRLKDINDLFMDTGIGSDSYAIIELKKVDEILNDKEQSRRALFEKAAGIAKFKKRKKETLARLELVEQDLARVGDLVFEIEKNLRSLERQAKQAERYFKHQRRYKALSVAYARKALARYRETESRLHAQIKELSDNRQNQQSQIQEREQARQVAKNKLEQLSQELDKYRRQLGEAKQQQAQLENERKLQGERKQHLEEKIARIRLQIQQDLQAQINHKNRLEELALSLAEAQSQKTTQAQNLEAAKQSYELQKQRVGELQRRMRVSQELFQGKQKMIYQMQQDIEVKQARLSAVKQSLEQNQSIDQRQQQETAQYRQKNQQLAEQKQDLEGELADIAQKIQRRQREIEALNQEIEQQSQQLNEQKRQLDASINEFRLTKSFVENMEGFPEALRFLSQHEAWQKDYPLVADIISCEPHYRPAIEAILEPFLNHYAVPHQTAAQEGIILLKEAKKGKAQFIILEQLPSPSADFWEDARPKSEEEDLFLGGISVDDIENQKAVVYPLKALQIVRFPEKYAALAQYLLQETYLVEKADDLPQNPEGNTYVSLDGQIVQRPYSSTGGSADSFEGKKIGRKQQLAQLQERINQLEQSVHEASEDLHFKRANLKTQRDNQSLMQARQHCQNKLNEVREQIAVIRSKEEQLTSFMEQSQAQKEDALAQIYDLEQALKDLQPKRQQEENELQELQAQVRHFQEEIDQENEELSQQSQSYNQQNIQYLQQQNMQERLEQEQSQVQNNLQQSLERLQVQENELRQTENKLEQTLEAEAENQEALEITQTQMPELQNQVNSQEEQYFQAKGRLNDLEASTEQIRQNREQQDELLQNLKAEQHENALALTGLRERLAAEFQINIEQLSISQNSEGQLEEEDLEKSEEILKQEAAELKEKMNRLGNINPMAMEAYQEAEERHKFINEQKKDLEESQAALLQTIEEAENHAREAFMEAYEAIRANFIKVFRSLFYHEDQADLVLSDPDNPLESRIEIFAQPKGKRPLTIDQLSGGEKTLTATSLLFALYLLKPAPFCIFDEVDAPLDDANTDKFNNIIREFSKESQFIIVTHNKRTMASTDIMYGVTMPENSGISRVVPVDLRSL